jgi:hypothetical protein
MKTNRIYILLLLVFAVLTSCEKKLSENTGDPSFTFKDATEQTSPTGYDIGFI